MAELAGDEEDAFRFACFALLTTREEFTFESRAPAFAGVVTLEGLAGSLLTLAFEVSDVKGTFVARLPLRAAVVALGGKAGVAIFLVLIGDGLFLSAAS
ncbi:hypothetical protein [Deinococcus peraridilitoris]|uniref:hypothetical protein n=1 Tax=Deinococcus peraridilitoris TaxID=432329 RepID=UPI00059DCEC4|nr:hypothetical protein [Deinococcus peraridilitoris]